MICQLQLPLHQTEPAEPPINATPPVRVALPRGGRVGSPLRLRGHPGDADAAAGLRGPAGPDARGPAGAGGPAHCLLWRWLWLRQQPVPPGLPLPGALRLVLLASSHKHLLRYKIYRINSIIFQTVLSNLRQKQCTLLTKLGDATSGSWLQA